MSSGPEPGIHIQTITSPTHTQPYLTSGKLAFFHLAWPLYPGVTKVCELARGGLGVGGGGFDWGAEEV